MRYNVELYNATERRTVKSKVVATEEEASKVARLYIAVVKNVGKVIQESNLDISPRGFTIGQTILTETAEFRISTAKMGGNPMLKAKEVNDFTICRTHCDWIMLQAKMLKALFSYDSRRMVVLNKTRALSAIDTMQDSLNELRNTVAEMEEL